MILKIYGLKIEDKLIAILLFKKDLNLANKIYFECRLMNILKEYGILPKEQHGGISGHTLIGVEVSRYPLLDFIQQKIGHSTLGL